MCTNAVFAGVSDFLFRFQTTNTRTIVLCILLVFSPCYPRFFYHLFSSFMDRRWSEPQITRVTCICNSSHLNIVVSVQNVCDEDLPSIVRRFWVRNLEQVRQDFGLHRVPFAQSCKPNGSCHWRCKPKRRQVNLYVLFWMIDFVWKFVFLFRTTSWGHPKNTLNICQISYPNTTVTFLTGEKRCLSHNRLWTWSQSYTTFFITP